VGACLKFIGELPPQIEDVQDRGILPEQLTMRLLQGRNTQEHQLFNLLASVALKCFSSWLNTMYALWGGISKEKGRNFLT
jgi:hypothetical protein